MKYIFIACLLFSFTTLVAQDKQKIIGKWKLIELSEGKIYMNLETDSLYIETAVEETNLTQSQRDSIYTQSKKLFKEIFSQMTMVFREDGTCDMNAGFGSEKNGSYKIDENKKIIIVSGPKGNADNLNYKFENGNLVISTGETDEGHDFIMMFKKAE